MSADMTYVPTRYAGFLYLAVILAVFSRRVVGWSMADHLRTELVVGAREMAIWNRRPGAGVSHHSDYGCQYTSLLCGEPCQAVGIHCAMGSLGDCYDNAMADSFFATLECELRARQPFRTHLEARTALVEYSAVYFLHPPAPHAALDPLSPDAFERRWTTHTPVVAYQCTVYQTGATSHGARTIGLISGAGVQASFWRSAYHSSPVRKCPRFT